MKSKSHFGSRLLDKGRGQICAPSHKSLLRSSDRNRTIAVLLQASRARCSFMRAVGKCLEGEGLPELRDAHRAVLPCGMRPKDLLVGAFTFLLRLVSMGSLTRCAVSLHLLLLSQVPSSGLHCARMNRS